MAKGKTKKKSVGYITLVLSPAEDRGWMLDIERLDPRGGVPFRQDYWFEDHANAMEWFQKVRGDEDIFDLHSLSDLAEITQFPGVFNIAR